jgi:hypothetical protein
MGIRFTRAFSALVSGLFCIIAFSSATADAGQPLSFYGPDERGILIAAADPVVDTSPLATRDSAEVCHERIGFLGSEWDCSKKKVYVCHVKKNGKYKTKFVKASKAEKKIEKHPDMWIPGKCEDVVSPS